MGVFVEIISRNWKAGKNSDLVFFSRKIGTTSLNPPVEIGNFAIAEQKDKIHKMLREESVRFMKDEDDIRYRDNLEMNINLKDDTPLQHQHYSIPKLLYSEVRDTLMTS